MEIYIHDSDKKEGFYFSPLDKCFHPLNKIIYKKLLSPGFYLTDLRDILDTRRDCIPVGDKIIFLNVLDLELCQSPQHNKILQRDFGYFFTWSLPFLEFSSPSKDNSSFLALLKEFCLSPVNKILELKISKKAADKLTSYLEVITPIFSRLPDNFIYKQDISIVKYRQYQKVWFGIIFNYENHTIRRTKIGKRGPDIKFSLIVCSDTRGLEVTDSEIESLNVNISELLSLLPLNL